MKNKNKTKTTLTEQVKKFMEHHNEKINKAYKLLQEEIKKNEELNKENQQLRVDLVKLGGYPREIAEALLVLKKEMDIHSVESVVLFGMSVVRSVAR